MRKRSKYRPKPVLQNPVGYVLEAINLKDMERAIAIVSEEFRQKKATPITA